MLPATGGAVRPWAGLRRWDGRLRWRVAARRWSPVRYRRKTDSCRWTSAEPGTIMSRSELFLARAARRDTRSRRSSCTGSACSPPQGPGIRRWWSRRTQPATVPRHPIDRILQTAVSLDRLGGQPGEAGVQRVATQRPRQHQNADSPPGATNDPRPDTGDAAVGCSSVGSADISASQGQYVSVVSDGAHGQL